MLFSNRRGLRGTLQGRPDCAIRRTSSEHRPPGSPAPHLPTSAAPGAPLSRSALARGPISRLGDDFPYLTRLSRAGRRAHYEKKHTDAVARCPPRSRIFPADVVRDVPSGLNKLWPASVL